MGERPSISKRELWLRFDAATERAEAAEAARDTAEARADRLQEDWERSNAQRVQAEKRAESLEAGLREIEAKAFAEVDTAPSEETHETRLYGTQSRLGSIGSIARALLSTGEPTPEGLRPEDIERAKESAERMRRARTKGRR